jgi:hypothetical protein
MGDLLFEANFLERTFGIDLFRTSFSERAFSDWSLYLYKRNYAPEVARENKIQAIFA